MITSIYTGAVGMTTIAQALNVTAHNLANVQTVGYKARRTNFADLMSSSLGLEADGSQMGHGATILEVQNLMEQGAIENSDQTTDAAINGRGFFKLRASTGAGDEYYYTRAGQFHFDANLVLANEQGYYVQGYNVDPATGVVAAAAADIDISGQYDAAQPTATVDLSLNLDSQATMPTAAFDPNDESSYNYSTAITVYDSNGVARGLTAYFRRGSASGQYEPATLTTTFGTDNDLTFTAVNYGGEGQDITVQYLDPGAPSQALSVSVTGDAVSVSLATDAGGTITSTAADIMAALNADVSASALIGTTLASATGGGVVPAMAATNLAGVTAGGYWDYYVYISASDAAGGVAVQGANGYLSFDTDGQLNETLSAQVLNSFDFADGATPGQAITFDYTPGTGGITPTSQLYGSSAVYYLSQDGYAEGQIQGVAIEDGGVVYAYFSNGRSGPLAYLALADFSAPQELQGVGENLWVATTAAGAEVMDQANQNGMGQIAGGKLEQSTVDVASAFVELINYQRGYQVNSKTITTSDQMLQTAVNMVSR